VESKLGTDLKSLASLLQVWCKADTKISDEKFPATTCWTTLLHKLVELKEFDFIINLKDDVTFSYTTMELDVNILQQIKKHGTNLQVIKFGLLSQYPQVASQVFQTMNAPASQSHKLTLFPIHDPQPYPAIYGQDFDAKLLSIIIRFGYLAEFVATPFYPILMDLLLLINNLDQYRTLKFLEETNQARENDFNLLCKEYTNEPAFSLSHAIARLTLKNFFAQAGSLVFLERSIHPMLRTLDNAVALLPKYLLGESKQRGTLQKGIWPNSNNQLCNMAFKHFLTTMNIKE